MLTRWLSYSRHQTGGVIEIIEEVTETVVGGTLDMAVAVVKAAAGLVLGVTAAVVVIVVVTAAVAVVLAEEVVVRRKRK